MAKGLSDLQKQILQIAYRNHNSTQLKACKADISNREALVKIYRFPPKRSFTYTRMGKPIFDRAAIGLRRYQAATVAVTKSFNRLVNRKLARRIDNHGISLTRSGVREAKRIKNAAKR